jgi:acyl-CoA synthetase (AMP-forming)/AMP-acid ligase II
MSECSPCTHLQTWEEGTEFPGAVGRLLPNMRAKYVSVDGETVSPGKQGELWVKGPNVFLGYLGNKKASEEAFSADGFYKTGDVGYEDCRGQLFITDRVKELIKYNTFQIAPAELEGLLLGHSAVADVAVVGVPSGQVGSEHARAYVVAKDKERATEQTARDIEEFVREKVVHYKRLRGGVRFVDEIPRNPSGKILKRELKERRCSRL